MISLTRRATMAGMASLPLLDVRTALGAEEQMPIIFLPSDKDDASVWYTQIWRFESNGYDRKRLFALNPPNADYVPLKDYGKPHPNYSTAAENLIWLAGAVEDVKRRTGADKVVLAAWSRSGITIRNYLKNGGGADNVAMAILCAAPNHGYYANDDARFLVDEGNGRGYLLRELNYGDEATQGVKWLTLRSDKNDEWFQPILNADFEITAGRKDFRSNIGYDSPELAGAINVVLPGFDNYQVMGHPLAFREMYRFITGEEPQRLDVAPESEVVLNGMVTGVNAGGFGTNLPVGGATVEIFAVSPMTGERLGEPVHRRVTAADGWWGPFRADPHAYYEFVITGQDFPINDWYRNPFPRSSAIQHFAVWTFDTNYNQGESGAPGSIVVLWRRNGGLSLDRDKILVDGKVPDEVHGGMPTMIAPFVHVQADKVHRAGRAQRHANGRADVAGTEQPPRHRGLPRDRRLIGDQL